VVLLASVQVDVDCCRLSSCEERGLIGRSDLSYFTLLNAEMETSKNGSSKLIVMTVLEPKDELDEVTFLRNLFVFVISQT